MPTPPAPDRALDVLLDNPARAGLFCDFDGTLSAIVDDPSRARPLPGAVEVLVELAGHLGRVGIVSGRPVAFVSQFFPPPLVIAGLYGLETRVGDVVTDHAQAGLWRDVVTDVMAAGAGPGPAGMRVESKGLSLTAHYRGVPEIEGEVHEWASRQAARSGLLLRPAKMSFELHPPIPADKGTALLELGAGLTSLAFVGDDIGDLPAFDALDEFAAQGAAVVRIAVGGPEQAPAMIERADIVADGPAAAVALLQDLAARLRD